MELKINSTEADTKLNMESESIRRACEGDLDAFKTCVDLFRFRVHSIAYQMTGNSEDARDIAQEVFLRLYQSLGKFDSNYQFSTWLYRITVNLAIDYRRKQTRHKHIGINDVEDKSILSDKHPGPDSFIEQNELRGVIEKICGQLSEVQRKVFILRDLQEFTTKEISQILRCKPSTVRVHLAKARLQIRESLKKQYPNFQDMRK